MREWVSISFDSLLTKIAYMRYFLNLVPVILSFSMMNELALHWMTCYCKFMFPFDLSHLTNHFNVERFTSLIIPNSHS